MKEQNPIKLIVRKRIEDGKLQGISRIREMICVKADISPYALKQLLFRDTVSKATKLCLLNGGFITKEDIKEYEKWFRSYQDAKAKLQKRSKRTRRDSQQTA